jgi:transcriptional regulator GlxA family with amidase domain
MAEKTVPQQGRDGRRRRRIVEIARVQLFLARHLAEVPPRADLAAMTGLSRSHFSRVFHSVTGTTVRDYVRHLRLQHATALLRGSTRSLTTIAVDCGFYDLAHFDKTFRREVGMSPLEFRHRVRQEAGHRT